MKNRCNRLRTLFQCPPISAPDFGADHSPHTPEVVAATDAVGTTCENKVQLIKSAKQLINRSGLTPHACLTAATAERWVLLKENHRLGGVGGCVPVPHQIASSAFGKFRVMHFKEFKGFSPTQIPLRKRW